MPNGGVQVPFYNVFHGNDVVTTAADARMQNLIYVDAPAYHSVFLANIFSNTSGRPIENLLAGGTIGTVIDESASSLVRGDFDGNSHPDLLVHWKASGLNRLYLNNPDRSVTIVENSIAAAAVNASSDHVLASDLNGDGYADVLFHWNADGTNRLFLGSASGSFTQSADPIDPLLVNGNPDIVLTSDFDGDGRADLLFYWKVSGTNRFFYGTAEGGLTARLDPIGPTAINGSPDQVVVGDYDGDGKSDLLFYWNATRLNRFQFGHGTGFVAAVNDLSSPSASVGTSDRILSFDANFDGSDDVDYLQTATGTTELHLGRPSRAFSRD